MACLKVVALGDLMTHNLKRKMVLKKKFQHWSHWRNVPLTLGIAFLHSLPFSCFIILLHSLMICVCVCVCVCVKIYLLVTIKGRWPVRTFFVWGNDFLQDFLGVFCFYKRKIGKLSPCMSSYILNCRAGCYRHTLISLLCFSSWIDFAEKVVERCFHNKHPEFIFVAGLNIGLMLLLVIISAAFLICKFCV